ncbi:MAG: hypothetical protein AAF907_08490, partial [Planctomycetota bacterium]
VSDSNVCPAVSAVPVEEDDDGFDGVFVTSAEAIAMPDEDSFDGSFGDGFDGSFASPEPAGADEEFVVGDQPGVNKAPPTPVMAESDGEVRELTLLIPTNSFSSAGNGTLRVSFDDLDLLKVLNAEPVPADVVERFPSWLTALDGKRITLRGFMYPTYADPVKSFILARDNQICCFGRNPKPYDLVTVRLAGGESSAYIQNRPFDVVGTFRIDPKRDGDDWLRLYRIDDARVVE